MCGICGFVARGGAAPNRALFEEMTNIVSHRGPDDEGFFYDGSLALGHRRLSILDLSTSGHQPMTYQNRYTVVYNGEIYNYPELRHELEALGHSFRSECDTEVLLASYAQWGPACTGRFNGMWAFAIYDKEERRLFCSRDRFGIKPFYYYADEGCFAFASEIKQLLLLRPQGFAMNAPRAWEFLRQGVVEKDETTFFEGIFQLPGGFEGVYSFADDSWAVRRWYSLEKIGEVQMDFKEACTRFRTLFEDAVRLRLRADVPVGSCLSGGLDSSAIVCAAAAVLKQTPGAPPQHTVSSVYNDAAEAACDEQEYIDAVVADTGVKAHKVHLRPQMIFEELDHMLWHLDEPVPSTSPCAQWEVFRGAREEGLTVMLDGQGSDEQLAGYSSFFAPAFAEMLKRRQFGQLFRTLRWYNKNRAEDEGVRAEAYLATAAYRLHGKKKRLSTFVAGLYARAMLRRHPSKTAPGADIKYPFDMGPAAEYPYDETDFRRFTLDMFTKNLPALLRYEDRNSMAHSVESRVPFIDYRLVEAVLAMPWNCKLRSGVTKAVLREGLAGLLTEKVRTRYSKLGFATPEDVWMRQHPEWFRQELAAACAALPGMLEEARVLAWFDACREAGRRDYLSFRIICLGRWARLFNVKSS